MVATQITGLIHNVLFNGNLIVLTKKNYNAVDILKFFNLLFYFKYLHCQKYQNDLFVFKMK